MDRFEKHAKFRADFDPGKGLVASLKAALLVDGSNVYYGARDLGGSFDFKALSQMLEDKYDVVQKAIYCSAPLNADPQQQRRFEDFKSTVQRMGYNLKICQPKVFKNGQRLKVECPGCSHQFDFVRDRVDGDMDVTITVDAIDIALSRSVQAIVLVSGDQHFLPLLRFLRGQGIIVEMMGFSHNTCPEVQALPEFTPLGLECVRSRRSVGLEIEDRLQVIGV